MGLKWLSGIGKLNKLDIFSRLNITQDGTLEIDGQPQQQSTGGGNAELLAIKEVWSGSANITKTFVDSMYGFDITNDGTSDLTFTINGMTITVKSGEVFSDIFDAFTSVSINTTVPYRATVKESLSGTLSPSPSPSNDTTPPNPVTNLVAGTVTTTSIPVSWTLSTSTDVGNYEVAYSTDGTNFTVASNAINPSSTSYTVNGLTSNTNYTIRVVAIDTSGNRSTNVTVTATTAVPADTTPPNDVTNLVTSNVTDTSLTLSWTASTSTDIASYDVYKGTTLLGNTISTSYNVTGLTASTSYTFKVVSKDTSGNVSTGVTVNDSTIASAPANDTTPPNITANPVGGTYTNTQTVTLTANESATIYYTLDGTTPTTSSSVYSSPISISTTTTLKYFGVDSVGNQSAIQTQAYTISTPTSQSDVVTVDANGYLDMPINQFDWAVVSSFTDTNYTTIINEYALSSLFDLSVLNAIFKLGNIPYVDYGNLGTTSSECWTANVGKLYIKTQSANGTTFTDVVNNLQNKYGNMKLKLSTTYKIFNISSNVSNTTTRTATTGYEYFKATLVNGIGTYAIPANGNDSQIASNGYEISPSYVWTYTNSLSGNSALKINSDSTIEMQLPSGTLSSIDNTGVSSYLASANIKIYYA